MKNSITVKTLALLALGTFSRSPAAAEPSRPDTGASLAEAQSAPVPADPQQTSASFGDWVVRCERANTARVCEVAQSLVIKGQQAPIAQIAFGHGSGDAAAPMQVTVLLPINIAFAKPPRLALSAEGGEEIALTFRRCVPGGCLADGKIEGAFLKGVKAAQKPGQLIFTDASDRTITLPLSFRGVSQAMDDLAKEVGKAAKR